jgi:hypothetical protein
VTAINRRRGLILFGLIVAAVVAISMVAYWMTGPIGIEERSSRAVGLPQAGEEPGSGWFGFSLEGDPVRYAAVLGALGIVCIAGYFWWRRAGTGE